jgi:ubiquinol-cytochrome c reductase iron-sulfur subunit
MTAIIRDHVDEKRRRILVVATVAAGSVAGTGAMAPLVASWFPSARARAASAPVDVETSRMEPGQQITVEWRGTPIWVLNRTPEMLDLLGKHDALLVDPQSRKSRQPEYAKGPTRSIKPERFVAVGVCTHLGCSPTLKEEIGTGSDMGADWPGGYFCPCHNSRFDLAGRVFTGSPAPTNLVVPAHRYVSETLIRIGEDSR